MKIVMAIMPIDQTLRIRTGETDSDARCDDVELVPLTLCSAPLFAAWCAGGPGP
jgi:hypothetical protein